MANLNTSATGGTLAPLLPLPLDDAALDAVFQTLVADVTGLPGNLVLPRWQPTVPKQPEPKVNWCAIGVPEAVQDDGPWLEYDEVRNQGIYWDHETLSVLATFYGPNAQSFARLLRAGLNVPQNTDELLPYAIRYLSCGPIRAMNELQNQQWVRRQDIALQFRRKVVMTYSILNIASSEIILQDDTIVYDDFNVAPTAAQLSFGQAIIDSSGQAVVDSSQATVLE